MNKLKSTLQRKKIIKSLRHSFVLNLETNIDVEKNMIIIDKESKEEIGYVDKIIKYKKNNIEIVMKTLSNQISYNIIRGVVCYSPRITKNFINEFDTYNDKLSYWKLLKNKYKLHKLSQEKTRNIRKQGLIGREYHEKY